MYLLCGAGLLLAAILIFKLLQNESIYHSTLGKIAHSYEREPFEKGYRVLFADSAFTTVEDEHMRQWDAAIYECIKDRGYQHEFTCFGYVRAAFFPLFPLLWKVLHLGPTLMCFVNFGIFLGSLLLLFHLLGATKGKKSIPYFCLAVATPASVIYFMPYSEALFLFSLTLAIAGIFRNHYALFFAGFFLMVTTRPATLFVLLAFLTVEVFALLNGKKIQSFLKDIGKTLLPFALGFAAVVLLQFMQSGSWTLMGSAQSHWDGKLSIPDHIEDWSFESYGITCFMIFFIALPCLVYLVFRLFQFSADLKKESLLKTTKDSAKQDFLFMASAAYMAGLLVFTFFTSQGNLHSFTRFTLCSPLFYILMILLPGKLERAPGWLAPAWFLASLTGMILFLAQTGYGGPRWSFVFFGCYLAVALFLFYLFLPRMKTGVLAPLLVLLLFGALLWNCYLFNCFLSNGWIFA